MPTPYLELHLHTPYSFLDGGSHIEDLVRRAWELGMPTLAMTDHDSVAAAIKFAYACYNQGIKAILGAELTMEDGSHLTLLAQNRQGYAHLCTLISQGYAYGERLTPGLPWDVLLQIENCKLKIANCPTPNTQHPMPRPGFPTKSSGNDCAIGGNHPITQRPNDPTAEAEPSTINHQPSTDTLLSTLNSQLSTHLFCLSG